MAGLSLSLSPSLRGEITSSGSLSSSWRSQAPGAWPLAAPPTLSVSKRSLAVEAKSVPRTEKVKTRHMRIRRKLSGTTERPRLAVFRSNKHIYAQVIDDTQHHTLAAASTLMPALREELNLTSGPTVAASRRVGEEIAKICLEQGITKVAFDRGGFIYHGRIEAVAEGARAGGLDF